MERVVVAKIWEIPAGERKIVVPFRGRAGIGVFNVKRFILRGAQHLPAQAWPALHGRTERLGCHRRRAPSVQTAAIAVDGLGEILRCPWHQWPFDIATGKCPDGFDRSGQDLSGED